MMNCRASSSVSGYAIQLISCLPLKTAARQRPKPARIVPFVVIRIGSVTDGFVSRAASLNSSSTPVQLRSSSERCSRNCSGKRTTGRPSNRLIAVGLKDCGRTGEIISTALELRMDAKSSAASLIAGTLLAPPHFAGLCRVLPRLAVYQAGVEGCFVLHFECPIPNSLVSLSADGRAGEQRYIYELGFGTVVNRSRAGIS